MTTPLDLLVTDVGLPHINGWAVAEALGRSHPSLRGLFVSGYAGQTLIDQALGGPGDGAPGHRLFPAPSNGATALHDPGPGR